MFGHALAVWLTLTSGQMWNFSEAHWTIGQVPGIELSCGPVHASADISTDRDGWFARSVAVAYERQIGRATITGAVSRYDYPIFPAETAASVSVRWRLTK